MHLRSAFALVVIGMALGSEIPAQPASVPLVRGQASDYIIVRPRDSSPSQLYAAEELQAFVEKLTGAILPIATDAEALPAKAIVLGVTRFTASLLGSQPAINELGVDGFRLCVKPPHVLVIGSPVRGTLYGVYELLERYGRCRWYSSFFSVIPRHSEWSIPVIDETQRPAFTMREPFWWDMFRGDFAARCRANGNRMQLEEKHGGKIRFGGGLFVHTFDRLMPPGEFYAEHPDYYSEIDGKRVADHTQLCLTNPKVLEIITTRFMERIRSDPGAKLFSLSQNDWRRYCTCEACREIDEREGSPAGTMIQFVNQVAAAVEKQFPDVWVETLAYQYTRHPPKTIKPRRNVVPRLCSIECDFSLPLDVSPYEQNRKFVEDIKGWSAITDKLYVWDYTTNFGHYIGPHPNFGCLQRNVQFFRDNHVVGLFEQGAYQSPHAEFAELRAWVLAKLLWDPDQSLDALYDDFFPGYYGAAAGPVRQYFDQLQALVASPEQVLRIWSPMTSPWYSDEFFEHAQALWQQAEQLVAGDAARLYNVRMSAMPVLYARLQRWPGTSVEYVWRDGGVRPQGLPPAYSSVALELLARISEGNVTHIAENRDRHNQFVSMLRGRTEGFSPVLIGGDALKAGAIAEMGARLCLLSSGDGANVVHPDAGGCDVAISPGSVTGTDANPYQLTQRTDTSAVFRRDVRRRYRIERSLEVKDGRLSVTTAVTSSTSEPQTVRPVCRTAFDLGDVDALALQIGAQGWQAAGVPANQTLAMTSLPVTADSSRQVLIASSRTGRGVRVILPNREFERVWMLADTSNQSVRIFAALPPQELAGKQSRSFRMQLEPLVAISGLPEPAPVVKEHRRDCLVVEDCLIPIGRLGTWGEYVADAEAEDGFAAKLFNTHFQWCMQWHVEPEWFEPEAKYHVQMRIKVEKSERDGHAFWAGVYDAVREKGCGTIQPATSDVKDGYQWYDVATWLPERGQYLWVGPGMFDKKAGAASAIRAVYVDKFRLTRVSE